MNIKNKKVLIPWIFMAVVLLIIPIGKFVLIPYVWGPIGVNILYSSGERVGKIIKIADRGLIWKTTEAEMVLSQGGFSVTYIWDFSVDNKAPNKNIIKDELQKAFDSGVSVKIKYDQMAGSVPWRSKTTYLIKDIEFENQ